MRIAIFGTTGAGKTTLIKELEKSLLPIKYQVYRENFDKCPYFSSAYINRTELNNNHDYHYKLDIWMLQDRYRILKESLGQENVIFDRCILDSGAFGEAAFKAGYLAEQDFLVYSDYFNSIIEQSILKDKNIYDIIIYLKVSPETAMRRIQKRDREDEIHVIKEYWEALTKTYDNWYNRLKDQANFIVLNGDVNDPSLVAKEFFDKLTAIK